MCGARWPRRRYARWGYTGTIVGVTGNVLDDDVKDFLHCGANLVIAKPFDYDKFRKAFIRLRSERPRSELTS